MNFELFIAKRISIKAKRTFSKLIVGIAITGIALGLASMISAFGIVTGFKNTIRDKMIGFSGDIQVSSFDLNASFESQPIPVYDSSGKVILNIKRFPEVSYVQAFATKPAIISTEHAIEGVVLKGIGEDYRLDYFSDKMIAGSLPDFSSDTVSEDILISKTIADRLQLSSGDDFIMHFIQDPIRKRKMHISGIYETGLEDLDKLFVIGDLQLIQRLNNWDETQAGGYELFINDVSKLDTLTSLIHHSLPQKQQALSVKELYPMIFDWLSLLDVNAQVILVLMLLVAGINMISALLIMILERTNMIGTLKALGANNASIRKVFLYNAIYLIGLGVLIGNALGIGFCLLQKHFKLIALDQTDYYMSYVPIELNPLMILFVNICTISICTLILILPSMLVAHISPVKAIRFK